MSADGKTPVEHYIDPAGGALGAPAAAVDDADGVRRGRRRVFFAGFAAGMFCMGLLVWLVRALSPPGPIVLEGSITGDAAARVIAAPVAGRVQRVAVLAGQSVLAGERLFEIAAGDRRPASDSDANAAELATARLAKARAEAMLAALDLNAAPALREIAGVDAARRDAESRLMLAQAEALRSRLASLDADQAKSEAGVAAAREEIAKLAPTLKLAAERAIQGKELFDKGFISKNSWTEREQLKSELERDAELARLRLAEAEQGLAAVRERRRGALADERQSLAANLADAERKIAELAPQTAAAGRSETGAKSASAAVAGKSARSAQSAPPGNTDESAIGIDAPAAGVIESIDVRDGTLVGAGDPLVRLRATGATLEANAFAPASVVSAIAIGQSATIVASAQRFAARVVAIEPVTGGGRLRVAVAPDAHDASLAQGTAVRIEVLR